MRLLPCHLARILTLSFYVCRRAYAIYAPLSQVNLGQKARDLMVNELLEFVDTAAKMGRKRETVRWCAVGHFGRMGFGWLVAK